MVDPDRSQGKESRLKVLALHCLSHLRSLWETGLPAAPNCRLGTRRKGVGRGSEHLKSP